MRVHLELTEVGGCSAEDCAYNSRGGCHAFAITVGDGRHPRCDTFFTGASHVKRAGHAGVGACKLASCRYNSAFECAADAVRIDAGENGVVCATFSAA